MTKPNIIIYIHNKFDIEPIDRTNAASSQFWGLWCKFSRGLKKRFSGSNISWEIPLEHEYSAGLLNLENERAGSLRASKRSPQGRSGAALDRSGLKWKWMREITIHFGYSVIVPRHTEWARGSEKCSCGRFYVCKTTFYRVKACKLYYMLSGNTITLRMYTSEEVAAAARANGPNWLLYLIYALFFFGFKLKMYKWDLL